MRQYEVTFIIDPVLPNDEIDGVARNYKEQLEQEGCAIVHVDAMGLRQLAYPINKRTSGIYYCIEFTSPGHNVIEKLELALRRDERIMRFLTVKLDKYGVKYNADKRAGLIGKSKKEVRKKRRDDDEEEDETGGLTNRKVATPASTPSPTVETAATTATAPDITASTEEE